MVGKPSPNAKPMVCLAEPPWKAQSAPWRQLDAHLSQEPLAREMRQAMPPLDSPALYTSSAGRGQAPHRPAFPPAIVLFALRRTKTAAAQRMVGKTRKQTVRRGGWAVGRHPARSCG